MNNCIAQEWSLRYIQNGSYGDYLIGIIGDDGDEMWGFATGADFPTVPRGKNNPACPS